MLEVERTALRLSPDEWIIRLYGPNISGDALDAVRDPVENALWELAARVLALGLDVILENGFWSRVEREDYRARATQLGARSELHFTNTSREEMLARLEKRNAQLPPGSFRIGKARLLSWFDVFEPPDEDELKPREASAQNGYGR